MPSLKELQESFSIAVFDSKNEPLHSNIKESHIENANRIKIYQDNVLLTLYETMKNRYGAICKLVDEDFFKHAINKYILSNKPNSGNLDDYGESFPSFLADMPELKDYPYLQDVAKLEWALHISYFASDSKPIDRDKLSHIPQEKLGDIKFKLHPSSHLISSKFPINKIWEITQDGYEGDTNIDINSDAVDILVVRPEYKINTIILKSGDYSFLKALRAEENLEKAFESACENNEEFDIGEALQTFVVNGTFVDFYF